MRHYQCIAAWEAQWDAVVQEIISEGIAEAKDCKWCVSIDDLEDNNDADTTFNIEIISAMLSERDEVACAEWTNDALCIEFQSQYCSTQPHQTDDKDNPQLGGLSFR